MARPSKRSSPAAATPEEPNPGTTAPAGAGASGEAIRVRMYRVGFGDFFLLTVPTASGPRHILIDCGVHAGDIGSMQGCVQDMASVTGRKLALVIVTHFHADHLSGFATQDSEFAQFEVDAVWITNRLDPADLPAMKMLSQVTALATHLQLQLALSARTDLDAVQAASKVRNATGDDGHQNTRAMRVVTAGFRNSPPVFYYGAGDVPEFPDSLKGAISAQILAPAPKDSAAEFSASDNRTEQYLAAVERHGPPDVQKFRPFDRDWPATAADYYAEAFLPWRTPRELEEALSAVQPDMLAAAAELLDGTLNNQSLVVLFTCRGKKLLFVGDAQWGNWSYWLYGKAVKGKDPGISEEAQAILSSIDFYKVGHHGSTNATPIPALGAMRHMCVGMCSTETGFPHPKRTYGDIAKGTEVPRIPLMKALEELTGNQLVRSDWLAVDNSVASPEAMAELERLPEHFDVGHNYIEYVFPP